MIDSEFHRQRLLEMITRWCEHTKIKSQLRDYDIPSLVGSILDEFYHITLCCGHKVEKMEEGINIAFQDFIVDRGDMEHGGGMGEVSGIYCKECAQKYMKELGAIRIGE